MNKLYELAISAGYSGQINNAVYNWLGSLGFEGALNNRILKYLYSRGGSGSINDAMKDVFGSGFTIEGLFSGRNGVWYDPTDLATMYQTHTGGSPVTANGQAVGLILDKSRELGIELVTNGDFKTDVSGWTVEDGATVSYDNGTINIQTTGYRAAAQLITVEAGKSYVVSFDVTATTSRTARIYIGTEISSGQYVNKPNMAVGSYSFAVRPSSTTLRIILATSSPSGNVNFDNISVKELIGIPATQSTASQRPTYNTDPSRLTLDGVDDSLEFTVPTGGWDGKMVVGTDKGTASYGVSLPAGAYELGGDYFFGDTINGVAIFEGDVSDSDLKKVEAEFVKNGAKASYGDVMDFTNYWRSKNITEFPLIDTSRGTNFYAAWFSNNLTSFPLIDTSNGAGFLFAWFNNNLTSFPALDFSSGTSFRYAWASNQNLTEFPENMFDNCLATNFTLAFDITNLSQSSIDNILVSIASNGTSNGTFDQSGGSAPSEAGEAAIDALVTRGWTVTVTGGYQGKILPAGLFDNDENGFWYSMDIGA